MSIIRNSGWNALGVAIPALIAIPTFAFYARILDVERLGLLTIAFVVMGYSSSFDLGLSRALIRQVAIDRHEPRVVRALVDTATIAVLVVAVALAAIAWLGVPVLMRFLKVSSTHLADASNAFRWLSLTVVPYLLAIVGSAYFEGKESFGAVNVIRTLTATLNAVAGVSALLVEASLQSVLIALFASRTLTCALTYSWYFRDVGAVNKSSGRYEGPLLAKLIRYGSWLTVSNVVGPLMTHFDRLVLSNLAGAGVVAFYTVPSEAVTRVSMFPSAISKALFPRLSRGGDSSRADRRTARRLTLASCALTLLPLFLGANWILELWVGPEYVGTPGMVLRILVVGWFFNALALDPFTHLQAVGRSKVTALIHLAELLPYFGLLAVLTHLYGIVGTAVAWTLRSLVDYLLMALYAREPR